MGGNTKVAWVKWDLVCKPKEEGGLGVKDLGLFNHVLLVKWAWQLFNEEDALWSRILISKYGELSRVIDLFKEGLIRDKNWSSWWRDLLKVVCCNVWFLDNIRRKIGDGSKTRFWDEGWCGDGVNLKNMFPRLFSL